MKQHVPKILDTSDPPVGTHDTIYVDMGWSDLAIVCVVEVLVNAVLVVIAVYLRESLDSSRLVGDPTGSGTRTLCEVELDTKSRQEECWRSFSDVFVFWSFGVGLVDLLEEAI